MGEYTCPEHAGDREGARRRMLGALIAAVTAALMHKALMHKALMAAHPWQRTHGGVRPPEEMIALKR